MRILTALIFLCLTSPLFACMCEQATLDEAIERSDFVFRANVFAVLSVPNDEGVLVTRAYFWKVISKKGGLPLFDFIESQDAAMCGVDSFTVPSDYWIFSDSGGGVSGCSPTGRANLERLGVLEIASVEDVFEINGKFMGQPPTNLVLAKEFFRLNRVFILFGCAILVTVIVLKKRMARI